MSINMTDFKEVENFILSLSDTRLDYPFGKGVAVYKVQIGDEEKMFALLTENKTPVSLSVKCDPQLAVLLREKYETVMAGYHLNKKHWNTVILSGQLPAEEIEGFIIHSYNLVTGAAV